MREEQCSGSEVMSTHHGELFVSERIVQETASQLTLALWLR